MTLFLLEMFLKSQGLGRPRSRCCLPCWISQPPAVLALLTLGSELWPKFGVSAREELGGELGRLWKL